jgi:hypothetical protein
MRQQKRARPFATRDMLSTIKVNAWSRTSFALVAFLVTIALGGPARATPDFPAQVEQCLSLDAGELAAQVDPPCGCHLCHVNGCAGGLPLTDFGTLMQAKGALPLEAAETACPALNSIQVAYPQLIADIKAGIDPNADIADSGPRYGCDLIRGAAKQSVGAMFFGACCVLSFARWRRARKPSAPVWSRK